MNTKNEETMLSLGNGVRSGKEYMEGLKDDREVWLQGKRVADVTAVSYTHLTLPTKA